MGCNDIVEVASWGVMTSWSMLRSIYFNESANNLAVAACSDATSLLRHVYCCSTMKITDTSKNNAKSCEITDASNVHFLLQITYESHHH